MYIKKTLLYTYIHALNISVPVAQMNRKQDCFFLPLKLLIKKAYKQQELYFHLLLNLQGPHISQETHQVFDKLFLHNADNPRKPAKTQSRGSRCTTYS